MLLTHALQVILPVHEHTSVCAPLCACTYLFTPSFSASFMHYCYYHYHYYYHYCYYSCICSFQAAEEEEAAEQLLLQQQQTLRSVGSKGGGAFQPWRGGQGAAAEPHQKPAAKSPGDEPGRSLGLDLRPKVQIKLFTILKQYLHYSRGVTLLTFHTSLQTCLITQQRLEMHEM